MKTSPYVSGVAALSAVMAFSLPLATHSAPPEKPATITRPAQTNAVPLSIYVVPKSKTDGRDPFFPTSTRVFGQKTPGPIAVVPTVDIIYIAFSGTPDHRLATITISGNGRTYAEGESGEVFVKGKAVRVTCTKITEANIELEVDGNHRVIPFRGSK